MFSTQIWLREMEEAQWNPSHASRARKKGAEGTSLSSLYPKGFCQGCSLRLTGTRGLVGEGGVEGVTDAFGS